MFVLNINPVNGSDNSDYKQVVSSSTGYNSAALSYALEVAMKQVEQIRATNNEKSSVNYNQDANQAKLSFWTQVVQYLQGLLGIKNPANANTANIGNQAGGENQITESKNPAVATTSKDNSAFTRQLGDPDVPDNKNGDCGPASLATALGERGVTLAGDDDTKTEKARELMGANPDETTWTNLDQLAAGAKKAGLNAEAGKGSISDIQGELQKDKSVIAHVNPKGYGGPDTSHFIVISNIQGNPNDPNTKVTIKDPLDDKPKVITVAQLQASMSGDLVSVGKRNEDAQYA